MEDTITINLRALTGTDREQLKELIAERLGDIPDEINAQALTDIYHFVEE